MTRNTISEFLEGSTIHGLVHISTAKSKAARAAWVAIVFACFATPSVTFLPMETEVTTGPSVYDSLKLAFDDPHTADVR